MNSSTNICANGLFNYSTLYHKMTLDSWTVKAHYYNCSKNGWAKYHLKKGTFGYDCMAYTIGYVLKRFSPEYTINEIAEMVHEAWSEIYIFWCDNKPWLNNSHYNKPAKSLNDISRTQLAETSYENKPMAEKEKDIIIATFIHNSLCK